MDNNNRIIAAAVLSILMAYTAAVWPAMVATGNYNDDVARTRRTRRRESFSPVLY